MRLEGAGGAATGPLKYGNTSLSFLVTTVLKWKYTGGSLRSQVTQLLGEEDPRASIINGGSVIVTKQTTGADHASLGGMIFMVERKL